ncbi:hypothetical protein GCM10010343_10060 [Streptomyces avidinii]|nr:hypothetical protein GCM10010343_10060 [Streptomyces avidinii]
MGLVVESAGGGHGRPVQAEGLEAQRTLESGHPGDGLRRQPHLLPETGPQVPVAPADLPGDGGEGLRPAVGTPPEFDEKGTPA